MQLSTGITFGIVGLAAALPAHESLEKRIDSSSNCGLDMYPVATQGPVSKAIQYLKGLDDSIFVDAGQCALVSCSYGTGVSVCVDNGANPPHYPIDPKEVGEKVDSTYNDCYGGEPGPGGADIRAFQHWDTGYNILVKGGYSC